MNFLSTYQYQLADHKKSLFVFYLVMVCIIILSGTLLAVIPSDDSGVTVTITFGAPSLVFAFVVGLCTFKETFLLSVQNGISRKSMFVGKLATILTVAVIMGVINKVLSLLMMLFPGAFGPVQNTYQLMFGSRSTTGFGVHAADFLFEFLCFIAAMACGYFITIVFYRLNRTGKVIVGAGVPIFCLIILPILDESFFHNKIIDTAVEFIYFTYSSLLTFTGVSLIAFSGFSLLAYVLMRRAVVKE